MFLDISQLAMKDIAIKHIDDFTPGLIRELCRLEIENLGKEASVNQWVIPVLIRYGLVTVAEKQPEKEIAGVCQVLRSYKDLSSAFIHSFYVRPHLRGKNIGEKLLRGVLKRIESDGFKSVWLTVDSANTAAVSLYESAGFRRTSVLRDEYGEGVDRVLYTLKL
jgi:ribosomal protein S18 acetylase RimI-like enzyme